MPNDEARCRGGKEELPDMTQGNGGLFESGVLGLTLGLELC